MEKINEVTTVSNLENDEFIAIVLADGSLGKIRKADIFPIASVLVDGLMSAQYLWNTLRKPRQVTQQLWMSLND